MEDESKLVNYKLTDIGMQNWEVCARMLAHDLVDMAERVPEVKELCEFYSITVLSNGAHTMALPRKELLRRKKERAEIVKWPAITAKKKKK
jgi:hypothetical protein